MKDFWNILSEKWPIVALAPMDGYTNSVYRQITKKIAPEVIAFSEFFSADGLIHSEKLANEALSHKEIEKPLIIQIFWSDPDVFAKAAKIIEQYNIAGIDINMWCPAKKVVSCGYGSKLMLHSDTAFRIVEALTKNTTLPISVKTRLGWKNWNELIDFWKGLENAGANMITVHGRTYKQAFWGDVDHTGTYELKKNLNIPVLINGDISTYDDGLKKTNNTDGFMIGRASMGNPWCFLSGDNIPSNKELFYIIKEHCEKILEIKWEKRWCLEIRKHILHYLREIPGIKEIRKSMAEVTNKNELEKILTKIQEILLF